MDSLNTSRYALPALPATVQRYTTPVLVIGGGAAGLAAALRAAEKVEVTLLVRGKLRESNSAWAQGGIAAALNSTDSPRFHVDDTLVAGAGLSDPLAVEALAFEAPGLMQEMAALGVPFEREDADHFALGLEGGHSQRRILHVGDTTGWAITSVLMERTLAHPRIQLLEGMQAVDVLGDGVCEGVLALDDAGTWHEFRAGATILATGGAGALYGLTSNQPVALGEGIAMAFRAGAEVADMEFVQFHPTVMRRRDGCGFLISEAARGEGGLLFDIHGERFMPAFDGRAELAPRDVVTRGIYAAMQRSGANHVLLDLTHLSREYLERRFPTIYSTCRAEGLDPATQRIPVAPASHYLMGGVRTDLDGATSLPGLYAAGECACTGVHGANRLASNSLLECLVFGRRAGAAAVSSQQLAVGSQQSAVGSWQLAVGSQQLAASSWQFNRKPQTANCQPESDWRTELAAIMRAYAGPLRTGDGLKTALTEIEHLELRIEKAYSDSSISQLSTLNSQFITCTNALLAARLIVTGALLREESRGGHFRADFPATREEFQVHMVQTRGQAPRMVETVAIADCRLEIADWQNPM
ncbi:MAG: L-aspartate oxidase [Chloroflexaceae bacterium]|jgi:L-aspartate oxidase|nr:L-aspartate oxidase [Chloroflexaceae bacterium]